MRRTDTSASLTFFVARGMTLRTKRAVVKSESVTKAWREGRGVGVGETFPAAHPPQSVATRACVAVSTPPVPRV